MAGAFQSNAFQNNAFQVDAGTTTSTTIQLFDVGSSISGGRFTEKGWQPIRPYGLKWQRRRHDDFIREERQRVATENKLSAIDLAQRDWEQARTHHDMTTTRERLNKLITEKESREYMEKLWADYREKHGRN